MFKYNLIESYLKKLEQFMNPLPASEKAAIIIEIKNHIIQSMEVNPHRKLQDILQNLGTPREVALSFLKERGISLKEIRQKIPITKWIIIGMLGTLGFIMSFILIILWQFSPVIQIDDHGLKFLGGTIIISDDHSKNHK